MRPTVGGPPCTSRLARHLARLPDGLGSLNLVYCIDYILNLVHVVATRVRNLVRVVPAYYDPSAQAAVNYSIELYRLHVVLNLVQLYTDYCILCVHDCIRPSHVCVHTLNLVYIPRGLRTRPIG